MNGTANEQIDALLKEDRELKAQIAELQSRRDHLRDRISAFGEAARDRWFFQEYAREMAITERKELKRRQRRAVAEQQAEEVAALRRKLDVNGTQIVEALKLRTAQG